MKIDLKPCPFCGGKASLVQPGSGFKPGSALTARFYVKCMDCDICTSDYETEVCIGHDGTIVVNQNGAEEAIKRWNRRKGDED